MHIIEVTGTVKFDNLTLLNPKIKSYSNFDISEKKSVVVSISMFDYNYEHIRTLGSFNYEITWEDADVHEFIKQWISENIG